MASFVLKKLTDSSAPRLPAAIGLAQQLLTYTNRLRIDAGMIEYSRIGNSSTVPHVGLPGRLLGPQRSPPRDSSSAFAGPDLEADLYNRAPVADQEAGEEYASSSCRLWTLPVKIGSS